MNNSETANKNLATRNRKRKSRQTQFDSSAGVIPKRTHGFGIWNGERKVVNIRIDEKLYKAVKPILKRYFGSVCGAIEPYLASIYSIATTNNWSNEGGVIPSITVDIGNLNIQRHMKARRKFVVEEEIDSVPVAANQFVTETTVKPLDYDSLSVEDLQREYGLAKSARQYGRTMVLGALLKKRVDSNG